MRELTQAECRLLFNTTTIEGKQAAIKAHNSRAEPCNHIKSTMRTDMFNNPISLIVHREQLPDELDLVLRVAESKGAVFVGGWRAAA